MLLTAGLLAILALPVAATETARQDAPPNVLIITVDALRYDRLSAYGYRKVTSPAIDALLAQSIRFDDAYTPEPLTAPSMYSMLTSLTPDLHGASRNAVPMRPGLDSLPKTLARHGYRTVAFVANWTLRDRLTGLGRHFDDYHEVLVRKRWWGLVSAEAGAQDVNAAVERWMDQVGHRRLSGRPWMLWIHYVDPHAPYLLHSEFARRLGLPNHGLDKSHRYDTEVAFSDAAIGVLLPKLLAPEALGQNTIVVFAADHGESLGEHGYWGHGRNLYQETVRVPLAIHWTGHFDARTIEAPASLLDVEPTLLDLAGIPAAARRGELAGFDWGPVLGGGAEPPAGRLLLLQAHRGAAINRPGGAAAREAGLLEVGVVQRGRKQTWRPGQHRLLTFDLVADGAERVNLTPEAAAPTPVLHELYAAISSRLKALGTPDQTLDAAEIAKLRSLGYLQ